MFKTFTIRNNDIPHGKHQGIKREKCDRTEKKGVMKFIKKCIIMFALLLSIIIVGRKSLYWFGIWHLQDDESSYKKHVSPFPTAGSSYNFKRMLELIEASREVRIAFYAHFTTFPVKKKSLDVEALKELLAEVYREKTRLRSFLQDLKGDREGLSVTKRRALLYYNKVLGQCAKELEDIMRKV